MNQPFDLLILSNGPGEITTWVFPVVTAIRKQVPDPQKLRISLVLSPCPSASGNEIQAGRSYPGIDRVQAAAEFWNFLLWGKTAENWDWSSQGVVVFLGGDQVYPVVIGKRLGYRIIIYAEWEARWYRWVDRFGVMNDAVMEKLPAAYQEKCTVVGDLMADIGQDDQPIQGVEWGENTELVGLLPGSKPMKLGQGVPLVCAIAEALHARRPQTQFILFVAPTLTLEELAQYGDRTQNPLIPLFNNVSAELIRPENDQLPYLKTNGGVKILLWQPYPAYSLLRQCRFCFTALGANTAQLGAVGVPMIVLSPSHKLDAVRSWDGIPGLLANLPLVGTGFTLAINWTLKQYILRFKPRFAWPNIWAKREIVPEIYGDFTPEDMADLGADWLKNTEKLAKIRQDLREVRGQTGAVAKLVKIIFEEINL